LRPWKAISSNNIYIIYLSILLFAFYAFSRHGFNGIALSTSLIASVPVGVAIAFLKHNRRNIEEDTGEIVFGFTWSIALSGLCFGL
jgi:hypothetical protein